MYTKWKTIMIEIPDLFVPDILKKGEVKKGLRPWNPNI